MTEHQHKTGGDIVRDAIQPGPQTSNAQTRKITISVDVTFLAHLSASSALQNATADTLAGVLTRALVGITVEPGVTITAFDIIPGAQPG